MLRFHESYLHKEAVAKQLTYEQYAAQAQALRELRNTSRPQHERKVKSSSRTTHFGVVFALVILYFVWGSTYLAIKIAVATVPPFTMLATRFLVAGGLLYLVLRVRGVPHPTSTQWWGSALVGTLLLVGGLGSATLAEEMGVASGLVAVAASAMPLWLALFVRFQGVRIGRLEWLGLGLGLAGVALLNSGTGLRANPAAAALLLGAPISWALGSVWSPTLRQPPGLMASAAQMLSAGLMLVPAAYLRGERLVQPPSLNSSLALLYLITFGSLLAYSAYVYLLGRKLRPTLLGSYAYINPVVAVLLGISLAGETLSAAGLAGMSLVLIGVILTVSAKPKGRKALEHKTAEMNV